LRRITGHDAVEQIVWQEQRVNLGSNLRKQAIGTVLGRLAKKHGAESQAAANRFFEYAQALDGAIASFCEFGARKGLAQLFDQRVMPSFNAPEPVLRASSAL
jgi:hypothetical protein